MHERFLNVDHKCKQWLLPIDRMALADRRITYNAGLTSDTQRVTMARHDKQKRNIRVFQQVLKPINPMISKPVRNNQRLVVIDFNKPTGISLWGYINQTF